MSETTATHEPEFAVLVEALPEETFNETTARDVLHTNGAYCAHCDEVHFDLRFKRLSGNVYMADCLNGYNFILMELVRECEIARKAYLEAGAPYGENDDGMWRWLRERVEAERPRWEAEQIELHHKQMAEFRKMIEKKRANKQNDGDNGA